MHSGRNLRSEKKSIRSLLGGMGKQQWILLLLLGLLLTVAAMPVSRRTNETTTVQKNILDNGSQVEKSQVEQKLADLLESVEGVGKVKVMVMTGGNKSLYLSEETEITGVLIAAEGAGDPVTVQNIQQAVMALFQVDAHKIKIMKMK